MHLSQFHYLPLSLPSFSILVAILALLILFVQLKALHFAYTRIGISAGAAIVLLLASLIGSYFNIPVAELPAQQIVSGQVVNFFGVQYVVPVVDDWPGTVIAVNVGGALIPSVMSLYLLIRHNLWVKGFIATACVAAICYFWAEPVAGLGIAMPVFAPSLITAIVALLLSRQQAAPLAYISGSLGTLIGADVLNLGKVSGLGAPVASIGGAGTFDGIFLIGILAVLIASLSGRRERSPSSAA